MERVSNIGSVKNQEKFQKSLLLKLIKFETFLVISNFALQYSGHICNNSNIFILVIHLTFNAFQHILFSVRKQNDVILQISTTESEILLRITIFLVKQVHFILNF